MTDTDAAIEHAIESLTHTQRASIASAIRAAAPGLIAHGEQRGLQAAEEVVDQLVKEASKEAAYPHARRFWKHYLDAVTHAKNAIRGVSR